MHDCFGKPLKPFDRVRAATKEELEAQGHKDAQAALSPAEKVIVACMPASETCNVNLADEVAEEPVVVTSCTGKHGLLTYPFRGGLGWATARTLVKLEG